MKACKKTCCQFVMHHECYKDKINLDNRWLLAVIEFYSQLKKKNLLRSALYMISSSANIIIKVYYINEYPKHQLTKGKKKKHLIESINDPRQHYKQASHKKNTKN